jgi:uncharacterized protein (DUF2164 family)
MRFVRALTQFIIVIVVVAACSSEPDLIYLKQDQDREVPQFSADSAFNFVAKQLEFGPRVPNTDAHRAASDWKIDVLKVDADVTFMR